MKRGATLVRPGRSLPWGLVYVLYQAWAIGLGSFWFYFQMAASSTDTPDPSTGHTKEVYSHGHLFYVEPWQSYLQTASFLGSIAVFIVLIFWAQARYGRESLRPFHPIPFAFAVAGGTLFWWLMPQAVRLMGA